MLIALTTPLLLFLLMYTGFAIFRYRAQGREFRWVAWLRKRLRGRRTP